jgi:hypothetical protein
MNIAGGSEPDISGSAIKHSPKCHEARHSQITY